MKTDAAATRSEPEILTAQSRAILTVTLNRPASGNSLSTAVIARLQAIFDAAAEDRSVNVIVLEGAGDKVFCAGHDLRELQANNEPDFPKRLATACNRMMQTILGLPQPVIAKVRGVATAAGCQLVATCDLAIAATDARFATPGVNIGTWCSTPMVALSRAVHRKHAMQLLLTGRLHDAEAAFRMGLVNEVVPAAELGVAVQRLAEEIASKSPYAIALGKKAFYRQLDFDVAGAYEYASELTVRNGAAADAKEGVAAFLEKRPARWIGR
ncbi:MAG: enoyl-CoA hydratase [Alphaproteobacteria bacterium]